MSFGDYVKCFGGMGSGWIVAAMKEKNCTENGRGIAAMDVYLCCVKCCEWKYEI